MWTKSIATAIAYNLDVINRSSNSSQRVVSVLIQIGWIEPTSQTPDKFAYRQINLDIRQFNPSLSAVFGENMSNNILLSSNLLQQIITVMPPIINNNNAAIQFMVFILKMESKFS